MIHLILTLAAFVATVATVLYLERRAVRRRIIRARTAFADAYTAMKKSQYDPYPCNFPLFVEIAEQAGWNLDYQKSRRGIW